MWRVGDAVVINGEIGYYMGERNVNVDTCIGMSDPNDEVQHWIMCMSLFENVYSKPFPGAISRLEGEREITSSSSSENVCVKFAFDCFWARDVIYWEAILYIFY